MERVVAVEAVYPGNPDDIFSEALDLREMKESMKGLARYEGLPDRHFKQGDRFETTVTLFGILKNTYHVMEVETVDHQRRLVQSRESSPAFQRWDHTLTIEPHPLGALWRDRVVIDTGWSTPVSALICRHLYRHRHRQRNALGIETSITKPD